MPHPTVSSRLRGLLRSARTVAALVLVTGCLAATASCGTTTGPRPANADPGAPSPPAGGTVPSTTPTTPGPPPAALPNAPGSPPAALPNTPGPGGSLRGTGSDAVALSFDDGPDPVTTPALLDLLKEHGVKATFCVVGFRARDHREVVARIAAEGHTLCNHSWQHLDTLAERDDGYLRWDLRSTNEAILTAAPHAKIQYFRAPYGRFTPRLVAFAAELGMRPIHWDVDDECWQTSRYGLGPAMVNHMTAVVQQQTKPGSMILSHENKKPHTVAAYRTILPWLKERFQLTALPTG